MEGEIAELDVIIPSFRVSFYYLNQIVQLQKPKLLVCNYYIIVDNPIKSISDKIEELGRKHNVKIVVNKTNLGASMSRNYGIELSKAEWLLFLDDDVVPHKALLFEYYNFIVSSISSEYLGAIGTTKFPAPINSFTHGIYTSQILTFFGIASWYRTTKWGTTSNLLINRGKIGEERFSNKFPKNGGGEDIDFFLRISKNHLQDFKSTPNAVVFHLWWNEGKRSYKRFFRWAYGDSLLPKLHKEHKYYNFPNLIETSLLIMIPFIFFGMLDIVMIFGLFVFNNLLVECYKIYVQQNKINLIHAFESNVIRNANDLGRIIGSLKRGNLFFLFERFDYFCDGKHIKTERRYAFYFLITNLISLLCYKLL